MEFINSTLDIIVSVLALLWIGGVTYYIYRTVTKVSVKGDKNVVIWNGNDNVAIWNDNKIKNSFNKKQ